MRTNYSPKKNSELVINQHKIDIIFHRLREQNGTKCYIKNRKRKDRVVQHYLRKYHIFGSPVEHFWRTLGGCILMGKAT